jgi:hypothetical protein
MSKYDAAKTPELSKKLKSAGKSPNYSAKTSVRKSVPYGARPQTASINLDSSHREQLKQMHSHFMGAEEESLQIEKRQTEPKPMTRSRSFLQGPSGHSAGKYTALKKKYPPGEPEAAAQETQKPYFVNGGKSPAVAQQRNKSLQKPLFMKKEPREAKRTRLPTK